MEDNRPKWRPQRFDALFAVGPHDDLVTAEVSEVERDYLKVSDRLGGGKLAWSETLQAWQNSDLVPYYRTAVDAVNARIADLENQRARIAKRIVALQGRL